MEEAAEQIKEKIPIDENQVVPIVVAAAAALVGTIVLSKLLCGGGDKKKIKKRADGKGPTGKGKAKIYHSKTLRSSRITWLIEELGIKDDFKIIEFNPFTASEEEMDWYKTEVNPHGLVPSLVLPDGTHMVESAAICMYIADKYGKMLPEPDKEPVYYSWMVHGVGAIGIHLNNVYHPVIKKMPDYRVDRANIAKSKEEIKKWLGVLEKHLDDRRTYICGEQMTAVDCVVGYTTMYASVVDNCSLLTAEDFPNVASYLTRLKKRPGFVSNVGAISDWP